MERDSMVLLMYLACLELPEGEGIEIEPDLWYYRTRHPASLFHHKLALTYPDTRVTQAVTGFDLLRVVEQAQLTGMLWHVDVSNRVPHDGLDALYDEAERFCCAYDPVRETVRRWNP